VVRVICDVCGATVNRAVLQGTPPTPTLTVFAGNEVVAQLDCCSEGCARMATARMLAAAAGKAVPRSGGDEPPVGCGT
jgi:hypothetical protein